jgi:hypothetical protein
MNRLVRKVGIVLGTLVVLTVNALANILPLNGFNSGEISDRFQVFFVPAGYVFAIWGVIYIALLAFSIYQIFAKKEEEQVFLDKIFYYYLISSIANSAWLFAWHYERFGWSVLIMLILLASLIAIYIEISKAYRSLIKNTKWTIVYPFSLYLGWISVATIANIADKLWLTLDLKVTAAYSYSWLGLSGQMWAVIMIVIAGILALLMVLREKDWVYSVVIIWALVGILVRFPGEMLMVYAIIATVSTIVGGNVYNLLFKK